MITVRIENDYEDGHHSERIARVDKPDVNQTLEDWWNDVVFPETGDGHGVGGMGSCYTATILHCHPVTHHDVYLPGQTYEWID
jgi:hypothetical protein